MEKINNIFDSRVDIVCDNYSSVFTKDDVVNLITNLRTEVLIAVSSLKSDVSISEMDFQEFSCNVSLGLLSNPMLIVNFILVFSFRGYKFTE